MLPRQIKPPMAHGTLSLLLLAASCADALSPPPTGGARIPRSRPSVRRALSPSSAGADAAAANGAAAAPAAAVEPEGRRRYGTDAVRPLHRNWWPVSVEMALDTERPNAVELLGMRLVLFRDGDGGGLRCLDDRCSHRFAPLSEGRVVRNSSLGEGGGGCTLQCAYHGWEFDASGECVRVPQREGGGGVADGDGGGDVGPAVISYPVRVDAGMVWVWSDPSTGGALSDLIPLPVSPLLRRWDGHFGGRSGFMRDLPYGMELLGENLLDLSHLPFSHHSVGNLDRNQGGPLPLRMLSEDEKEENAVWEDEYRDGGSTGNKLSVLPMFQAEVVNASLHDPTFLGMKSNNLPVPDNSTCVISFHDPCHIRYRRVRGGPGTSSHIELFMCPTRAGHSRVFLFNVFEAALPPLNPPPQVRATWRTRVRAVSPPGLIEKLKKIIASKFFRPDSVRAHMICHSIFDGDGIFLHKQGGRMRNSGLTFRDYATPSSADILLNAYRRYLDSAARMAEDEGHTLASSSVSPDSYSDDVPRLKMLDRHESHTAHCSVCSKELGRCERRTRRLEIAATALIGASGASATALTAALFASAAGVSTPAVLLRIFGAATLSTVLGSIAACRSKRNLAGKMARFKFEDYVHAEKD